MSVLYVAYACVLVHDLAQSLRDPHGSCAVCTHHPNSTGLQQLNMTREKHFETQDDCFIRKNKSEWLEIVDNVRDLKGFVLRHATFDYKRITTPLLSHHFLFQGSNDNLEFYLFSEAPTFLF